MRGRRSVRFTTLQAKRALAPREACCRVGDAAVDWSRLASGFVELDTGAIDLMRIVYDIEHYNHVVARFSPVTMLVVRDNLLSRPSGGGLAEMLAIDGSVPEACA